MPGREASGHPELDLIALTRSSGQRASCGVFSSHVMLDENDPCPGLEVSDSKEPGGREERTSIPDPENAASLVFLTFPFLTKAPCSF